MNTTPLNIKKPFGPIIGKTKMPITLVNKLNDFIDNEYSNKKKLYSNLDHGSKLAGQVSAETKLPEKIII